MSLRRLEHPIEHRDIGRQQTVRWMCSALGMGEKRPFQMDSYRPRLALDRLLRDHLCHSCQ